MELNPIVISALVAALVSGSVALLGILFTSWLTRDREHEADWRKTKVEHYQEYVTALSGVVSGRVMEGAQERYADAVNALALVASPSVLIAVRLFQNEISYRNKSRSDQKHDELLHNVLIAMREDVQPRSFTEKPEPFHLLAPPPADQTQNKKSN